MFFDDCARDETDVQLFGERTVRFQVFWGLGAKGGELRILGKPL